MRNARLHFDGRADRECRVQSASCANEEREQNPGLGPRESHRELDLLETLMKQGKLSETLKETIIKSNFDNLLEQRKYDVLGEYLNGFGRSFLLAIFHYVLAAV